MGKTKTYRNIFKNINIKEIVNLLEPGNIHQPSYTHAVERLLGLVDHLLVYGRELRIRRYKSIGPKKIA